MLTVENSVLVVIDVQEKLFRVIHEKDKLLDNLAKLVKGMKVLGVPVVFTEQYPQGLGPTLPELAGLLPDFSPLPKLHFSCCGDAAFLKRLESLNRRQVLITGIETHVCVYQTVADLLAAGYEVQVVADGVSSRTAENRMVGLAKMQGLGAVLTSTETALFELLKVAEGEKFKEISRIVK